MGKGPGLCTDIGKKARGLLYRDYNSDHNFTLTTYSPTGVTSTSTLTNKGGDQFLGDISTKLKIKKITTDIKVDSNSNLFTTVTVDESSPGLKAILNFAVPDQRSAKYELQYLHDFAGIITSVGLAKKKEFTKCNVGASFTKSDHIASFTVNDKGASWSASYYHMLTNTAVGAEVTHNISTGVTG